MTKTENINNIIKDHLSNYLKENNLEKELFINNAGFFAIKDFYNQNLKDVSYTHYEITEKDLQKKFLLDKNEKIMFYLSENVCSDYEVYKENPNIDIDVNLKRYREVIWFAAKHFILAHKGLAKKLFELEDKEQNYLFSSREMENVIMRYWLVEENQYEKFLERKQMNSQKGFDDYLFHTALSDLQDKGLGAAIISQNYISTILSNEKENEFKENEDLYLNDMVVKSILEQDMQDSHINKIYKWTKDLLMQINDKNEFLAITTKLREHYKDVGSTFFLNYELFDSVKQIALNDKQVTHKLCNYLTEIKKPQLQLSWDDNKLKVNLDKEIFFVNNGLKHSIITKLDEIFLNNIVEAFELKTENITIYNQEVITKYIYEITCSKDIENYEENKKALEKVVEYLFNERCSNYEIALEFQENKDISYEALFREYLLMELMKKGQKFNSEKVKRKI